MISLISILTAATLNASSLEEEASDQSSWHNQTVELVDSPGRMLNVYLTSSDHARLNKFPESDYATAHLKNGLFDEFYKRDLLRGNLCDLGINIFPNYRSRKFTISGTFAPFTIQAIQQGVLIDGTAAKVENIPKFYSIKPKLEFSEKSRTVKYDNLNINRINKELDNYIHYNYETGKFHMELPGWHEIACDLIFGDAKLSFRNGFSFEAPLLTVDEFITRRQLEDIHRNMIEEDFPISEKRLQLVKSGLLLNQSLSDLPEKIQTQLINKKFEILTTSLIDLKTGSPKPLVDFERAHLKLSKIWREHHLDFFWVEVNTTWKK